MDIVHELSLSFAIDIVNLTDNLISQKNNYVLCNQIMKSGTSIGANITEAKYGFSKSDFRYKMSIALKEANETKYWLLLLKETKRISEEQYNNLNDKCSNITRILYAIVKNSDSNHKD